MKIASVRPIPLGGFTHDHGWPGGTDPNVQYNTLLEVTSEDGIVGIGSCYTTRALVEGSLQLLKEHLLGESALERRGLEAGGQVHLFLHATLPFQSVTES
jgi:L-alanine-DL-glutamate epimerase-like enolase superfamily enzyme